MSGFSYAPQLLAEERQQPMNAAEHAAARGHVPEFIRDVPSSCTGDWTWDRSRARYRLIGHAEPGGCPWHTPGKGN